MRLPGVSLAAIFAVCFSSCQTTDIKYSHIQHAQTLKNVEVKMLDFGGTLQSVELTEREKEGVAALVVEKRKYRTDVKSKADLKSLRSGSFCLSFGEDVFDDCIYFSRSGDLLGNRELYKIYDSEARKTILAIISRMQVKKPHW